MAQKKPKRFKLFQVREPNGRLSRSEVGKESSPGNIKRLRDAALRGMADPEWGTELGRLFLAGKIEAPLFAAGKRWAEKAVSYHLATCAPSSDPKAASLVRRGHSNPPDPDSPAGLREAFNDLEAVKSFKEAHAVLMGAGKLSESIVRSCCEQCRPPVGQLELERLVAGLFWLATYWGLTERAQNVR